MTGLTSQDTKALKLFADHLKETFPERLEGVQVFGSKARGEATKFSDVDVLVVLKDATRQDRHTVSRLTSRVLLDTNVFLSPKTLSPQQLGGMQQRGSMFWQSIEPDLVRVL